MTPTTTIELGGNSYNLERPSGRKASRALAQLRALSRSVPELNAAVIKFRRDYEAENVLELDRAQARLHYPPRPLIHPDTGLPILEPELLDEGTEHERPNPRAGELVLAPSPLDALTDEDWESAGNVLRRVASPTGPEIAFAMLDVALELAEDAVYRLLALFTISNTEVKTAWRAGSLDELLDERAGDLVDDAYGDELLELAVTVGELVDTTFVRKARDLGDRLGNLGRLVGLGPTTSPTDPVPAATPEEETAPSSSDGPSSSTPASSMDSAAPTPDGAPTTPSTPRGTSSPSSSDESATTTPPPPRRSIAA